MAKQVLISENEYEIRQALRQLSRQRKNFYNRHHHRKRIAHRNGKTLVTELEMRTAFAQLALALKTVRVKFIRIRNLELTETRLANTRDIISGRNRLRLAWGKE